MHPNRQARFSALRHAPLAACVAAMFLAVAPAAPANTVPVTNCLDSGTGSLRAAVAAAGEGDIVDMTGLTCSSITLTTGEIATSTSLILSGPGTDKLRIDGNHNSRVLSNFAANGTLDISDLSIVNGYVYSHSGAAHGGCIYSSFVSLINTNVSGCSAQTYSGNAKGGGIYSQRLVMSNSTLSSNSVGCYAGGSAWGGAAWPGDLFTYYSTISNNLAACRPGGTATAGGAYIQGARAIVKFSTISNNTSSGNIGGIGAELSIIASRMELTSSTVSGNTAAGLYGGMFSRAYTIINNSTIAFNVAGAGSPSSGVYRAAGLHVDVGALVLNSSLIANNTYGPVATENDFSSTVPQNSLSGSNNLIRVATSPVPFGTITGACPLLGPLRNNGGPTLTHALLSRSPGIDAGSNPIGLTNDQRGPPFMRVDHGVADIGAYEVQQEDIVFNSGFDGCP